MGIEDLGGFDMTAAHLWCVESIRGLQVNTLLHKGQLIVNSILDAAIQKCLLMSLHELYWNPAVHLCDKKANR